MPTQESHERGVPVGIAGAGRMGQALGRVLRERGEPVVAVASRTIEHARAAATFIGGIAACTYGDLVANAGRVLIAVPDDAIAEVAATLARDGMRRGVALHTCGARGPEVLGALAAQGVSCGALHPLQTVPTPADGVRDLPGAAFAVDGEPAALEWAEHLAALLGGQVLRIAPAGRALYHAAAVMASNYIVALMDAAVSLMQAAGVDEASARTALAPLARATIQSVIAHGTANALTGPIQRGDAQTVAGHLAALARFPEPLQHLYRAAGLQALEIAGRRSLPPDAAAKLDALLK